MLKERIIELLEEHPHLLTMQAPQHMYVGSRHFEFSLPGLILMVAGYHLQGSDDTEVRLPLNAPHIDKEWFDYERSLGLFTGQLVNKDEDFEVVALARQVWAAQYGEEEAKELPFYDDDKYPTAQSYVEEEKGIVINEDGEPLRTATTTEYYWDHLEEVVPDDIIMFMKNVGRPNSDGECDMPYRINKWEKRRERKRKRP